ncbi:MAG: DUF2330 domain-containing protein [Magnetococcus sp. WYHC-3]
MTGRMLGQWAVALGVWLAAVPAWAFCGFYVARAESGLFNEASRVVMVRDEGRTVLTMASDYQGDPREFAVVIPVPTVLEREQIHVGNMATIDHLDAYSAPRLVEYHDEDPCQERRVLSMMAAKSSDAAAMESANSPSLGVTVEATYTVGEYDILILSATQSDGLVTWLLGNGYRLPTGAEAVLGSYLRQGLKFFVARVNLKEQARLGFQFLRPLQVAYESPRFMLPIRLGMVNARGPQELFVFMLNRTGRVETTNYRTVRVPSDVDLPTGIKPHFADFYRDMFRRQVEREGGKAVFLEYAWDMNWCDPCAADPLSGEELRSLGVFWQEDGSIPGGGSEARNVFVTRLHVRYDAAHFPEDLMFQETGDRGNFQARYVLRHPWTGAVACAEGQRYQAGLPRRLQREVAQLEELTGWNQEELQRTLRLPQLPPRAEPWWRGLWR